MLPPTYPAEPSAVWPAARERNRDAGIADWGGRRPPCTGGQRDSKTWLAQNWDWIGAQLPAVVLLRVTGEDGRYLLTLTEAGMLAKIGMNERGLGVCLNISARSTTDWRPACRCVLLRLLLGCDDVRGRHRPGPFAPP
ncbi:MAG: hypothetical protein IPM02_11800 [Betaproteobacteria bacterium]|nr:hypothetical protein [Betaproteobacteria bacterium]